MTDALAVPAPDGATRSRPVPLRVVVLLGGVAVLALVMALSVRFGSRSVGLGDIAAAFGGARDTIEQAAVAKRIPRTLLAVVVGASLAVAGAVMQGVTRNPLADPGILGVNMGASLAVVIGVAFFGLSTAMGYIWVAILGSAITATFVYVVGSLGRGGATPLKLALAGVATSAAFSAMVTAIALPRNDIAGGFRLWQVGGVGGGTFRNIGMLAPFFGVGFVIAMLSARGLNSLALGDELAAGLGERVARTRLLASFGAVLLCGAATAIAGPIAFVGLVVPHACRLLIGVDHRWLLPASALGGAILLTGADVVGRVIARPQEVAVGIITALVGGPVFIVIVRRQKVRAL